MCPGLLRYGGAAANSASAPEKKRLWAERRNSHHPINKKQRNKKRQLKTFLDPVLNKKKQHLDSPGAVTADPGQRCKNLSVQVDQSLFVIRDVVQSNNTLLGQKRSGCGCSRQNKTGLKALHKFELLVCRVECEL